MVADTLARRCLIVAIGLLMTGMGQGSVAAEDSDPFGIEVVDAETGRGVPLVTLRTPDRKRFVTDSAGLVAVDDPGLFGTHVYFEVVETHGYDHPSDGFGFRGRGFDIEPGGSGRIELERQNIAQRLYRTTGAGIYEHAVRLGRETPIDKPLLNAQVAGSDSTLAAIYRGRIFWIWGDTDRMSYPLGNFDSTVATSPLPQDGGLNPEQGVNYDYYVRDDGFVRSVADMPGDGPTWMGSPTVFEDADGEERLYAVYTKIRDGLDAYQWGLARWNDAEGVFDHVTTFEVDPPGSHSQEHTFRHTGEDGETYIYFANPLALTRVRDDLDAFADPRQWEHYTPLVQGTSVGDEQVERDEDGEIVYAWKQDTRPLSQGDQERLIEAGVMQPEEALIRLRDAQTGRTVRAHTGSTYWNDYREKWVMIFVEVGGENSHLGEVWYAEANQPQGPWEHAHHILTHDDYDFYNPKHHPFFDQDGGRIIFFEGTYTHTFSGNKYQTPRYEYNQVMYKLELDDPRLAAVGEAEGELDPNLANVIAPNNAVIPLPSDNSPDGEGVQFAIDGDAGTKYLNFDGDEQPSGFEVTIDSPAVVTAMRLTSADDNPDRDPASYRIEGLADDGAWVEVASGKLNAFAGRHAPQAVSFDNDRAFDTYRILFPTVANPGAANSMQIAQVELLADPDR